jgi:hypothetical protein
MEPYFYNLGQGNDQNFGDFVVDIALQTVAIKKNWTTYI